MRNQPRMWKCEVFIPRTEAWTVLDETADPMSKRAYERYLLKFYPILKSRHWRVVYSDRKPATTLFTMSVPLTPGGAR